MLSSQTLAPSVQIFGKARMAVFVSLLDDGSKGKHLRQIAREGKVAPTALGRELDGLVKAQILTEERVGNLRLFRFNPDSPLVPPLRDLTRALLGGIGQGAGQSEAAVPSSIATKKKSDQIGLSAPYDWSNPDIGDEALILKVATSLRFEDLTRLCAHYGVEKVRETIATRLGDELAMAVLNRQLKNIELAIARTSQRAA